MPFVTHGNIYFSPVVAPPLPGKNPVPIYQHQGYLPFPGVERKLTSNTILKEIPDLWPPRQGDKNLSHGSGNHAGGDKNLSHGGGGDHAGGKRTCPPGVVA